MIRNLLGLGRSRVQTSKDHFPISLEGSYEIRGDRVAGIVGKAPLVKNGAMWIEAWRGRTLVAQELVPDTGDGFLNFAMPFGGRFTPEELVRETVVISARSERGDTGNLKMNGATRLELIRKYLGIPVEPVFDLDFSRSGNARTYLGAGWSGTEELHTWAIDTDSFVYFDAPVIGATYLLRMTCSAFITEFVQNQTLEIVINDTQIGAFNEDAHLPRFREFHVYDEVFRGRPRSEIRLHHPRASRPSEQLARPDDRRLSFCFLNLSLVRPLNAGDKLDTGDGPVG